MTPDDLVAHYRSGLCPCEHDIETAVAIAACLERLDAAEAEVERLRSFVEMQGRVDLRLEAQRDEALERLAATEADADRLCARLERATLGCREKADVEAFRLHDEAVTRRSQP